MREALDLLIKKEEEAAADDSDGAAVFLSDMTEEEFANYEYEETHGWKGFKNQIMSLGKDPNDTTDK